MAGRRDKGSPLKKVEVTKPVMVKEVKPKKKGLKKLIKKKGE